MVHAHCVNTRNLSAWSELLCIPSGHISCVLTSSPPLPPPLRTHTVQNLFAVLADGVETQWVCERCGSTHDRDVNAANDIEAEGLRMLIHPEDIGGVRGSFGGEGLAPQEP